MKTLRDNHALASFLSECDRPLAFVPTMGYLHAGHMALLRAAKQNNATVLMGLFVNPKQFNQADDFEAYPRDEVRDLALAEEEGTDAVWLPKNEHIYSPGDTFLIQEHQHSAVMEGLYRPGHFAGVATVILKMCLLLKPESIYLGEKDWQQLQLVKDLLQSFFVPTKVVGVPTQREASGLAMSSRNARLGEDQLQKAAAIFRVISSEITAGDAKAQLESEGFKVDYVQDHHGRRHVAAWIGGVRLIDNIPLKEES